MTVEIEPVEPTVEPLPNEDFVEVSVGLRGDVTKFWRYHFEQSFRPGFIRWAWKGTNCIEVYVDPDIGESELLEDLRCFMHAVEETNELIDKRREHTDEGVERVRNIIHTWRAQSLHDGSEEGRSG